MKWEARENRDREGEEDGEEKVRGMREKRGQMRATKGQRKCNMNTKSFYIQQQGEGNCTSAREG